MDTVTIFDDPAAEPDLAAFALARLERQLARQSGAATAHARVARGSATFSVFLDCLALGLGVEARRLVDRERQRAA